MGSYSPVEIRGLNLGETKTASLSGGLDTITEVTKKFDHFKRQSRDI